MIMASNKVDYLIRLVPDDSELRKKLSSGEILNKSEMGKIKKLLTSVIDSANRDAKNLGKSLQDGLNVDSAQLERTLRFISGIFSELEKTGNPIKDWAKTGKGVYQAFDNMQASVAALAQNVNTLQTGLNQLNSSFESFKHTYQSFKPAQFADAAKDVEKMVEATAKLTAINLFGDNGDVNGQINKLNKLKAALNTLKPKNYKLNIDDKDLEAEFKKTAKKLNELWDQEATTGKSMPTKEAQYYARMKAIEERQIARGGKSFIYGEFTRQSKESYDATLKDWENQISEAATRVKKKIAQLEEDVNGTLNKGLSKVINDQLSSINLRLSLSDADKQAFKNAIDTYVDEINTNKYGEVKKVNVGLDLNEPEKETKKGRPRTKSQEQINVTKNDINKELKDAEQKYEELIQLVKSKEEELNNSPTNKVLKGSINKIKTEIASLEKSIISYKYLLSNMDDYDFAKSVVADWKKFSSSAQSIRLSEQKLLQDTRKWRDEMSAALTLSYTWTGDNTENELSALFTRAQDFAYENPIDLTINREGFIADIEETLQDHIFNINVATNGPVKLDGVVGNLGATPIIVSGRQNTKTVLTSQPVSPVVENVKKDVEIEDTFNLDEVLESDTSAIINFAEKQVENHKKLQEDLQALEKSAGVTSKQFNSYVESIGKDDELWKELTSSNAKELQRMLSQRSQLEEILAEPIDDKDANAKKKRNSLKERLQNTKQEIDNYLSKFSSEDDKKFLTEMFKSFDDGKLDKSAVSKLIFDRYEAKHKNYLSLLDIQNRRNSENSFLLSASNEVLKIKDQIGADPDNQELVDKLSNQVKEIIINSVAEAFKNLITKNENSTKKAEGKIKEFNEKKNKALSNYQNSEEGKNITTRRESLQKSIDSLESYVDVQNYQAARLYSSELQSQARRSQDEEELLQNYLEQLNNTAEVTKQKVRQLSEYRKELRSLDELEANNPYILEANSYDTEIAKQERLIRNIQTRQKAYSSIGIPLDDIYKIVEENGKKEKELVTRGLKSILDAGNSEDLIEFIVNNILKRGNITQLMSKGVKSPYATDKISLFGTSPQMNITDTINSLQRLLGIVQQSSEEMDRQLNAENILKYVRDLTNKGAALKTVRDIRREGSVPTEKDFTSLIEPFKEFFDIVQQIDNLNKKLSQTSDEKKKNELTSEITTLKASIPENYIGFVNATHKYMKASKSFTESMDDTTLEGFKKAEDKLVFFAQNIVEAYNAIPDGDIKKGIATALNVKDSSELVKKLALPRSASRITKELGNNEALIPLLNVMEQYQQYTKAYNAGVNFEKVVKGVKPDPEIGEPGKLGLGDEIFKLLKTFVFKVQWTDDSGKQHIAGYNTRGTSTAMLGNDFNVNPGYHYALKLLNDVFDNWDRLENVEFFSGPNVKDFGLPTGKPIRLGGGERPNYQSSTPVVPIEQKHEFHQKKIKATQKLAQYQNLNSNEIIRREQAKLDDLRNRIPVLETDIDTLKVRVDAAVKERDEAKRKLDLLESIPNINMSSDEYDNAIYEESLLETKIDQIKSLVDNPTNKSLWQSFENHPKAVNTRVSLLEEKEKLLGEFPMASKERKEQITSRLQQIQTEYDAANKEVSEWASKVIKETEQSLKTVKGKAREAAVPLAEQYQKQILSLANEAIDVDKQLKTTGLSADDQDVLTNRLQNILSNFDKLDKQFNGLLKINNLSTSNVLTDDVNSQIKNLISYYLDPSKSVRIIRENEYRQAQEAYSSVKNPYDAKQSELAKTNDQFRVELSEKQVSLKNEQLEIEKQITTATGTQKEILEASLQTNKQRQAELETIAQKIERVKINPNKPEYSDEDITKAKQDYNLSIIDAAIKDMEVAINKIDKLDKLLQQQKQHLKGLESKSSWGKGVRRKAIDSYLASQIEDFRNTNPEQYQKIVDDVKSRIGSGEINSNAYRREINSAIKNILMPEGQEKKVIDELITLQKQAIKNTETSIQSERQYITSMQEEVNKAKQNIQITDEMIEARRTSVDAINHEAQVVKQNVNEEQYQDTTFTSDGHYINYAVGQENGGLYTADISGLATEETLQAIYNLLGGDGNFATEEAQDGNLGRNKKKTDSITTADGKVISKADFDSLIAKLASDNQVNDIALKGVWNALSKSSLGNMPLEDVVRNIIDTQFPQAIGQWGKEFAPLKAESLSDVLNLVKEWVANDDKLIDDAIGQEAEELKTRNKNIEQFFNQQGLAKDGKKFYSARQLSKAQTIGGTLTPEQVASNIAKRIGVEIPIEPKMKPAAVAEEVKENVAEIPARVSITPAIEKFDKKEEDNFNESVSEEDEELDPKLIGQFQEHLQTLLGNIGVIEERISKLEGIDTPEVQREREDLQEELGSAKIQVENISNVLSQFGSEDIDVEEKSTTDTNVEEKDDIQEQENVEAQKENILVTKADTEAMKAHKVEVEQQIADDAAATKKPNQINTQSANGGILGVMRQLATESTLQKVLNTLGEIAKKNAMANSGKANSAQDLLEQFRRMLESDAWEGRERVAYVDLATGSMSNSITGDNEKISAERLNILRSAYKNVMDLDAQVHTHANEDDPYFSPDDLKQFASDFANGITKQILLSKNNMTVLDMSDVKDVDGLLDALSKTEHNFEALATAADKFGAKYINRAFNEITPQGLVKMLGIKGVESKLNETETRDSAVHGMLKEDAKIAADMLQESTGRAVKKTVERVGAELMTTTEKTDAKGNKTWSKQISDKYTKAALATNKAFNNLQLENEFGIGTDAQLALVEYRSKFEDFLYLIGEFKKNPNQDGLQELFNQLLPKLDEAEEKLNKIIVAKDKFLGNKEAIKIFKGADLANAGDSLRSLATERYAINSLNPGDNIAFNGVSETPNGTRLLVDVLKNGIIQQYALEVDRATGQVKEFMVAETALANAFQNVNKAMRYNETVMANVAIGNNPSEQAAFMNNAHSFGLDAYKEAMANMEKYVADTWNRMAQGGASASQQELDYIMALSERVITLGKNVQKTSVDFKNFWAQNPDNVFGFNIGYQPYNRDEKVREAMEGYARTNADANDSAYNFVSFDNDTLQYTLTDVEGHINKVTLQWNELYNQMAIVSDKSTSTLDPMVAKINKYDESIQQAIKDGYLMYDDGNLDAFYQAQGKIQFFIDGIKNGIETFATARTELEALRQEALKYGEDAIKTANKNRKLYTGTNEINSVNRQRDKIIGTFGAENFNSSDVALVNQYKNAYKALQDTYKKFAEERVLYDTDNQERLRQQAVGVQNLGRKLMASIKQAEDLKTKVEQSGVYTDTKGNEIALGGIKDNITSKEAENLRATMTDYVQNTLKHANIENIKFNKSTQQLTYTQRISKDTVADMVVAYNAAENSLYAYNKQERESLTGFPAFLKGFKAKMASIMQYVASITSFYRIFAELRRGVQYIREIDSALTELKKVTDETEETYDRFLQTAAKTADKVGSTIQKVVNSAADWSRLGYSLKDAQILAESTSVLLNVSEFQSIEDATSALTSTLQAFGYTAEQSMSVVDVLNEVGNNFAISSDGIATALQDSASSLMAANNSYEEAVALIAAANRVVQDPNSVGAALRTISLRLRGTSVQELEESGEDTTGVITSKSKLRSKVKSLSGVDILTDTGAYKSTYEILLEISKVWEDMSDINQAALLEIIAGKTRSNTAAAILSNTKDLEEAYVSALEAEGSALQENEKYLDSIQGRIDLFTNAVQTMWNNALDSDVVKWAVDVGTALIKIVDTLGLIPTILAAIGAVKGLKFLFKGFDLSMIIQDISALTMGTKMFRAETVKATMATMAETAQFHLANSALVQYAVKMGLATGADVAKMTTTQLLGLSFKVLGTAILGATKAMIAFLFTNPIGWMILLIGAVAGGVAIFNHFHKTTEELAEELQGLKSELSDVRSEIDSVNSELETTRERMAELLAMSSLSFIEQEELSQLKKTNDELERRKTLLTNQEERLAKQTAAKAQETVDSQLEDTSFDGDVESVTSNALNRTAQMGVIGATLGSIIPVVGTALGGIVGMGVGLVGGIIEPFITDRISTEDKLTREIENYDNLIKRKRELENQLLTADDTKGKFLWWETDSEYDKIKEELDEVEKEIGETEAYIDTTLSELGTHLEGIEYGQGADEALDFYNTISDKWEIMYGSSGAKSSAIESILSKDKFATLSNSIDEYVQKLKDGDKSAEDSIRNLLSSSADFVAELKARGMDLQDAVDYFTLESGVFDSDTIEGITAQYTYGIKVLNQLKDGANFNIDGVQVNWNTTGADSLFDEDEIGKFEARADKFAEILKGVDNTTRETFMHLAESVKNGTLTWEQAIDSFQASGLVAAAKLIESEIAEINTEMFKDLGDELSGIIDTLNEFSAALESVAGSMEILNTAQIQMANSGRISVKTALELMQSTDNWNELLEIENGNIRLVDNATEILIQSKLDLIKKNLQSALATVEAQLAEISATEASADMAYTIEESTNLAVQQLAGNMAYLTKLMEAYARQAAGETIDINSWISQAETAKATVLAQTDYKKNSAERIGTEALEQKKAELEAMLEMYEGIDTSSEFSDYYDYDKTPGDKDLDGEDGRKEDALSDKMDDFQEDMDYWENRIAANQAKYDQVQNEIDLLEAKGQRAGEQYYQEQITLEEERQSLLEQQRAEAYEYLDTLEEGSDEWWEVANTINDIEGELDDVISNVQELNEAIANIHWDTLEEGNNRYSNLISDLQNIRDILSSKDMFDDEGNWTEAGVGTLATHIQERAINQQALNETNAELAKFDKGYEGNEEYYAKMGIESEQDYYDRVRELTEQQHDYTMAVLDSNESVVEMYENQIDAIEEYTSELVNHYNDYIDSVREALDAERDLYEFKKDVQKQTKDIATLERRIASLSGSTRDADIAERRQLEAELYEAKEGLNDTYYSHAKDSQQAALEEEAAAYEETMNRYIEGLRTTLKQATVDMTTFVDTIAGNVVANADIVYNEYTETGLALDEALTKPWEEAAKELGEFGSSLELMNDWTKKGGVFDVFKTKASEQLKLPWTTGKSAVSSFNTSVKSAMKQVYENVKSNVQNAVAQLNKLKVEIGKINDTDVKIDAGGDNDDGSSGDNNSGNSNNDGNSGKTPSKANVKKLQEVLNDIFYANIKEDGIYGSGTRNAVKAAQRTMKITADGSYGSGTRSAMISYIDNLIKLTRQEGLSTTKYKNAKNKLPAAFYAKGTPSTPRDEWAITDEPQFGDELVLIPGKDGNLQYMRKGTAVMPADISANLIEWGKLNPSMMSTPSVGSNLNIINNAVNKPEFKMSFDSLVHVDNCSQDTLKDLEKMVDTKINQFTKQMNYAVKRFK